MHEQNHEMKQDCCVSKEESPAETKNATGDKNFLALSILAAAGILAVGMVYSSSIRAGAKGASSSVTQAAAPQANAVDPLEAQVFPQSVELPVVWGDLGKRMMQAGIIDQAKFEGLYAERGGMTPEMKALLTGTDNSKLVMTQDNSAYILNLLWALGLGQQSPILTNGPLMNNKSIRPEQFASTGGWTLGTGNVMNHLAKHSLLNLTAEEQQLVAKVAQGIYRPCCGNSTYYPDCNHGMGMLGLLELMASQGANEASMYQAALYANSYWFPDTYIVLANYFKSQGVSWDKVDPRVVLGQQYSSAGGYRNIAGQLEQSAAPQQNNAIAPRRTSPGCGA